MKGGSPLDDIIEKALGYILMITGIVANIAVIISSRKPAKKRKRKKR